jgi:tetrapyrrole methylase family protein/MazG family protein
MAITVVGLGPGDGRLLTREAWELLATANTIYLRTGRHPAVADLPATLKRITFDHVYETAGDFEAVYRQIVAELLQLGREEDVIYAVPGHPFVGEATVTALVAAAEGEGIEVAIVSGLSFVEPALAALGLDALDGLQLFDAIEIAQYHYPPVNPDVSLLLGQVYNRLLAGELKMVLTAVYPEEHTVCLIHAAGAAGQRVESLPLYEIDRSPHVDHLTSLYVPPLPAAASLPALAETVATLRSPEGCPWDQEQTPQSMRAGFLEEAGEVLAALDEDDPSGLREELGDVLYHLVMQAQMAAETETFRLADVIAGIEMKLKRRHPHVWGNWQVADSAEVVRNWELLKQQEKPASSPSLLDGIPYSLPALARSQKIQNRVRRVGFDWPNIAGVYDKVAEEIAELQAAQSPAERAAELGDLLFVLVNVAAWLDVDAESALREANLRFSRRFAQVEQLAAARELDLSQMNIEALETLWQEVKKTLAKDEMPAKVDDELD